MTKVKLGSILIEQKKSVKAPDGNGLDLIGVSNAIGLHVSRAKRIDDLSRYKFIEKGWFAYNPMRVNVGSIGFAYKEEQIGIVSPDYVVFSCSDKILPEYLLYLLKSDEGIEEINKNASGAVRKRLYFSDLARIEIVLPSIESQRNRLLAFRRIKELRNQISEHQSQESLLSHLKQAILQESIQGKLTEDWRKQNPNVEPASELLKRIKAEREKLIKEKKIRKEKPLPPIADEEIPFELPEGWVWSRLGDIIINADNLDIQKKLHPREIINYIDIDAIDNKKQIIREAKELPVRKLSSRARRVLKSGQILYSLVRPYLHNLAIVADDKPNYIGSTGFAVFDCIEVKNKFVFWLLLSKYIEELYLGYMDGFNSPSITHDQFRGTMIPLPPIEEQSQIVEKVESLMEKCRALESEISQSEQHAQVLMQAVLKKAFENKPADTPELSMAAEPEVEYHSSDTLPIPPNKKGFAKLVLAGKIISECKDSKEFTNIKFQKLQHLAEHLMEADLNLNYYNQAAGPYDNRFMHTLHNKMSQQKWFASQSYKYVSLEKSEEIDGHFSRYFGTRDKQFSKLINLLGKATEDQCEIISTLYAVWNDRIIKGEPTEYGLLIEDFFNWSKRKQKYTTKQLNEAIQWMKDNELEPKGFGELIKHAKKKKTK